MDASEALFFTLALSIVGFMLLPIIMIVEKSLRFRIIWLELLLLSTFILTGFFLWTYSVVLQSIVVLVLSVIGYRLCSEHKISKYDLNVSLIHLHILYGLWPVTIIFLIIPDRGLGLYDPEVASHVILLGLITAPAALVQLCITIIGINLAVILKSKTDINPIKPELKND